MPQVDPAEAGAAVLGYGIPVRMAAALSFDPRVTAQGYRAYLDKLIADAASPADPVDRILVEQLAFAHHRAADLHVESAAAGSDEAAGVYAGLAARLMTEVRQTAIALEQYRTSRDARRKGTGR